MRISDKKKWSKYIVMAIMIALIAVFPLVCFTGCTEIREDHYVLTTSENADGTLTITACTVVKDKPVVIPAEHNGKKIKALGDGSKAVFGGCEFSTLIINEGVEEIAENACLNWTPLKKLTLNNGLLRIGANAFSGCTQLAEINVPDTVVSIGEGAFENTEWYKAKPNGQIIYAGSFLYEFKGNMPSGTEVKAGDSIVGDDAKYNNVKYISDYAFSGCLGLKTITFPTSLEKIGAYSFYGCTALETISIPETVNSVGKNAFADCTKLNEVTIPKTIGSIAPSMFNNCFGLVTVNIEEGITTVGEGAFQNCMGLQEITLPASVTVIEDYAFKSNNHLVKVDAPKLETIGSGAFDHCIRLNDFVLSDSVKDIGNNAFYYCESLKDVTLPASVKTVGEQAFNYCVNLESLNIKHKASDENELSFGQDTFGNCFKLSLVTAENVADWCHITFANDLGNPLSQAKKLTIGEDVVTELVIPEGIEEIHSYAFTDGGIEKVTFPKTLRKVGAGAFIDCLSLKTGGVYAPDIASWCGITFEDEQANPLYYGEKLCLNGKEEIALVIPESVTEIKAYAFYNDTSLVSVKIHSGVETVGANAFTGCSKLAVIAIDLGEQPETWDASWCDSVGTELTDNNEIKTDIQWNGKTQFKWTTNLIMAIVVFGILVTVGLVLLVMWGIRKIKKKRNGGASEPAVPSAEPVQEPVDEESDSTGEEQEEVKAEETDSEIPAEEPTEETTAEEEKKETSEE